MAQLIVRAAEDETEEELSPEQIEQAVRVAWIALQDVPAYTDRIHKCPALFDVERN